MISAYLQACFLKNHGAILSLVYYMLSENESPVFRFGHWAHRHTHPSDTELTSQRIRELFSRISFVGVVRFWLSNALVMATSSIWCMPSPAFHLIQNCCVRFVSGRTIAASSLQVCPGIETQHPICLRSYRRESQAIE